jgi:hypothetical protein
MGGAPFCERFEDCWEFGDCSEGEGGGGVEGVDWGKAALGTFPAARFDDGPVAAEGIRGCDEQAKTEKANNDI